MNKQQEMQRYFDRAVGGILKQGTYSRGNSGNCRYKGCNDTKCAIGHLIPDKKYNIEMEGFNVVTLIDKGLVPSRWGRYKEFLRALQQAHDNAGQFNFMNEFKEDAKKVARWYNLEYKF
jgi:hypothetical protein